MTTYNVHIFREMRLVFGGIEADSHEAAAGIARDRPADQADSIDDECDGENLAALVDVAGDEQQRRSRVIDFEPERQRKVAPKLLAALRRLVTAENLIDDAYYAEIESALDEAGAAIAEAEAAGISPSPPTVPMPEAAEIRYANSTEIVPGVFIDPGAAIYIADRQGEIVTWNHGEIAADPSGFTAALAAVAIATKYGPTAVRENIETGGTVLTRLTQTIGRQS